ncbi:MAG: hypothetical protein WBC85_04135 [Planktotalea sp.]|uniref:hypothetical protein n=1 Tax=Planktotalea sp. TaxID=2029877 RepID=UPI003C768EC1
MSVDIMEHIWSDTMELRQGSELSPLARLLTSLLAAPTICFTTKAGGDAATPLATCAGDEVLPGASLADVLYQEFGIEMSDETIVFIEPCKMSNADYFSGKELGHALGNILVELAGVDHRDDPTHSAMEKAIVTQPAQHATKRRMQAELVQ